MSENWSVKDAKFLTNQFSWNKEECYVVPLYHYESPFTGKELAYVEKKLRDFFRDTAAKKKYMLIQNAQADLTMVRVLFGIPVLYWNVIDTISAELALDENLRFISNFRKDKNYSLDTLLSHYGSFFYLDETTFGKSERGTLKDTPLEGDALNYCAMDSQSLLAIFEGQLFRASKENFGYDGKESYLKTFKKFVSLQMSNNMHAVSTMEQYGTPIDVELIQKSLLPGSDFSDEWKKLGETFYAYPSVKKANKILLKEKSKAAQSIFGGVENVFSITSPDHLKLLFFGVLGLEPVSFTKKKEVSVDDIFQDFYKDSIPEVATYQEFQKYNKLKNTYLVGWYKKIAAHPDSSRDFRIRPNYGFYRVVTGRSNSSNPSLQQIPARHHSAKYIKRLFAAPVGHLGIKLDYSAHEVRGLSIAAGDKPLAEAFRLGRELRRKYIVKPLQELWKRIELDGDVHKLNCSFIMKIPIESVTKELRSAFKAIIFGLIYGKGLSTLANDIKKTKEETEKILGQFFQRFKRSKIWLDWAVKTGRELLYVYSPFGRKRNLYAYLTGMADMCAAMDRRAMNAPIQGMAADMGHTANRLYHLFMWETLLKFGYVDEDTREMPCVIEVMVHDSMQQQARYDLFLISAYILQWVCTIGITEYYKKNFNVVFTVPPEIELEVGADMNSLYKWDFSINGENGIKAIVKKALLDQKASGRCDDIKDAYKAIMDIPQEVKDYLDEKFPVLPAYEPPEEIEAYFERKPFF